MRPKEAIVVRPVLNLPFFAGKKENLLTKAIGHLLALHVKD